MSMRKRLLSELGSLRVRALLGTLGAATLAVAIFSAFGQAAPQVRPANTVPPVVSGEAAVGSTLSASTGTWTGTEPIDYSYRWRRCNASGANCVDLGGGLANDQTYIVRSSDASFTLRVRVTARNSDGDASAQSLPTQRVVASSLPPGATKLSNGETSIPVTSVPATERLIVDSVDFTPDIVRTRSTPITIKVKVKDTRGYVVRDVLVFVRSTPVVTSTPSEGRTQQDGTVTYTVQPEADLPIRNGYAVQFFVRARKEGDRELAGIAGYRLVQVTTAR
jgi:hypothetical protein